nr:unnamed protein product [Callosobruchus chinensis]
MAVAEGYIGDLHKNETDTTNKIYIQQTK